MSDANPLLMVNMFSKTREKDLENYIRFRVRDSVSEGKRKNEKFINKEVEKYLKEKNMKKLPGNVFPKECWDKVMKNSSEELFKAINENAKKSKYMLNTPLRIAAFMGQCAVESNSFRTMMEGLNYSSVERIEATWPNNKNLWGMSRYDRMSLVRNAEKLANVVYSGRMGNGNFYSGDGYRFIGRGFIQLTGRTNYTLFSKSIGLTPKEAKEMTGEATKKTIDYLQTIEGGLESALFFWTGGTNDINLNEAADLILGDPNNNYQLKNIGKESREPLKHITRVINGGYNHLKERIDYTVLFYSALTGHDEKVFQVGGQTDKLPNYKDPGGTGGFSLATFTIDDNEKPGRLNSPRKREVQRRVDLSFDPIAFTPIYRDLFSSSTSSMATIDLFLIMALQVIVKKVPKHWTVWVENGYYDFRNPPTDTKCNHNDHFLGKAIDLKFKINQNGIVSNGGEEIKDKVIPYKVVEQTLKSLFKDNFELIQVDDETIHIGVEYKDEE